MPAFGTVGRAVRVGLMVVGAGTSCSMAGGPLRPIALTGTDGPLGPGLGAGVVFSNMQLEKTVHPEFGTFIPAGPCISGTGSVVFGANLSGPGISVANGSGIWAARGGSTLSLVARRGDSIPGLPPAYTYGEFFTAPQICDTHVVNFQSMIGGPDVQVGSDEAAFTERSGWMRTLVHEGVTSVPGSAIPTEFGLIDNTAGDPWGNNQWLLTRNGDSAIRCFVRNNDPALINGHTSVCHNAGGPLVKHYRGGDTTTIGSDTVFFLGSTQPRINDSGAMLSGRLDGGFSLWSTRALNGSGFGIPGTGPLRPIFRSGDLAPGTSLQFYGLETGLNFSLNVAGRVGFAAQIGGGEIGGPGGYWSDARFGVLQLIALSETAAPGVPGEVFNNNSFFVINSALSDNNNNVIKARLKGSSGIGAGNDVGLWTTRSTSTGQPGLLRLAIREGDMVSFDAPSDYQGLSFGEPDVFWVNSSGLIAFMTLHNDFTRAIWIERADGTFWPLVKEFTVFDVFGDGTDMRFISEIDVVPSSNATGDGRRSAFNDAGDIAVRIRFVDGAEGIFTTAPAVSCISPSVVTPPASQQVEEGQSVTLSVGRAGTGPIRHQWRFDGVPIPGAIDPQLTITNMQASNEGDYDVVLTSACGTATSAAATLSLADECAADFNSSGTVTVQDIFDFLSAYFAALPAADFNGVGGITVQDIFDYLAAYFVGCP